ncbi:hypothetical protein PL78_07115 [Yersinia entomophaga]|uniref:Uncharacterized protein n=1 Tax=Yersinia entomophaga TaxID=935293 RepID=A0ABM6BJ24_YERET|nr:hypothetical protein PL78_07115 [Yersinia entomophaga]
MAFNSDPQGRLMGFFAGLQCLFDLRQDLLGQLQENFSLSSETQRLAFTYKQTEPQTLLQITELM